MLTIIFTKAKLIAKMNNNRLVLRMPSLATKKTQRNIFLFSITVWFVSIGLGKTCSFQRLLWFFSGEYWQLNSLLLVVFPSRVTTICCVMESQFAVVRLQEHFIHSDLNQLHQTVRSIPPSSSSSSILNTGWTFLYSLLCLSLSLTCLVKKYKKVLT